MDISKTDIKVNEALKERDALVAIRSGLGSGDALPLRHILDEFSDVDGRHILFSLDASERAELLTILEPGRAAELIEPLPAIEISLMLERLEPQTAADIISALDSSYAGDILEALEPEQAEEIRFRLDEEAALDLASLDTYEEGSAGWMMNLRPVKFYDSQTVRDVLRIIIDDETALDSAYGQHPYVITTEGQLIGVLSLRSLLIAKRATPIKDVMIAAVAVESTLELEALKDFFDEYDFLGAPVVGENGELLGAVSKEDVMDAWRLRLQSNNQKARGVVADELRSMPLLFRSRRRLAWLSANIGLNVIAASVISSFEDTLSAVIALAIFLPMVSDMSGCSGNQAVAVSMREISLGIARPSDWLKIWRKEAAVGLLNGFALGIIIGLVVWIWKGNLVLSGVIGTALFVNTVIAVSIGGCVPLLLKRLNVDPAVASGPLLTTITDMAGFFLVLGLATLVLPFLV